MSSAIPVHVALVDDTNSIAAADMAAMSAALNEQIQADFVPIWHVRATVGVFPNDASIPHGQWAIHIQKQLDQPGALGYHTNETNQPVSFVEQTDTTSVTVSHELLEMLADPWGSRMHPALLPEGTEGQFQQFGLSYERQRVWYLLEVADPCEQTSYEVGGVAVSDFLLPAWYRSSPMGQDMYSRVNGCTAPRQVADGGYVSFANQSGEWFQVFNQGGTLQTNDLGNFDKASHGSLREWVDQAAREHRAGTR